MRIIAGKHRGTILSAFQGQEIRPTPDRVKESVFQILSGYLQGARVLDLFAGSGALGLECLSRGASEAVFNDESIESVALLKKNLVRCNETGKVYGLDYAACLQTVKGPFDLILCDPPYRLDISADVLSRIEERGLLQEDGLVVYESEREIAVPAGWETAERRTYGRVNIFFLKRRNV